MKIRGGNALNIVQNVLIAVLFVSMLALSTACFVKMTASLAQSDAGDPFDIPGIDDESGGGDSGFSGTTLLPGFIAVSNVKTHLAVYDYKTVNTAYKLISKDIVSIMSSGTAKLVRSDINEWLACNDYSKYVYFRFRQSVPLPVLLDYAGASAEVSTEYSESVSVTEAYMAYFGGEAALYIRCGDDIYSVSGSASQSRFNTVLKTVQEADSVGFTTVYREDGSKSAVLLSNDSVTVPRFCVDIGAVGSELDSSARALLLEIFQMNPSKTAVNEYPSGGLSLVDTGGALIIDGKLTYTAHQLSGANLSGIMDNTDITAIGGYIHVSERFITEIMKAFGNVAFPAVCFESVSVSDGILTVSYVFLADNMPIFYNGAKLGISLSFDENMLVSASADIVSVGAAEGSCTLLSGILLSGAYPSSGIPDAFLPACIADEKVSYSEWMTVFAKETRTGDIK